MHLLARLITTAIGNTFGISAAAAWIPGFDAPSDMPELIVLGAALTAANITLKPLLKLALGPLILLTLGFGLLVVNVLILYLLDFLFVSLTIHTVQAALLAAIGIGVLNIVFHLAHK